VSVNGKRNAAVLAAAALLLAGVWTASADESAAGEASAVRVGNMEYDGGKTGKCFADDFLTTAAREMEAVIAPDFYLATLGSDEVFEYPFIVMSGEGAFTLNNDEQRNLRDYLDRGGFLLASAGCSNAAWSASFEAAIAAIYPGDKLVELDTSHPLFHTVYDVTSIDAKNDKGGKAALYALTRGDRVAVVYSPLGLNDTPNAGQGCCCCGGNEIRNAKLINVNILAYALTH